MKPLFRFVCMHMTKVTKFDIHLYSPTSLTLFNTPLYILPLEYSKHSKHKDPMDRLSLLFDSPCTKIKTP